MPLILNFFHVLLKIYLQIYYLFLLLIFNTNFSHLLINVIYYIYCNMIISNLRKYALKQYLILLDSINSPLMLNEGIYSKFRFKINQENIYQLIFYF